MAVYQRSVQSHNWLSDFFHGFVRVDWLGDDESQLSTFDPESENYIKVRIERLLLE